ncbi:MAG: TlpA family protein disulfide reductase [Bacteroidetes bacterium]|nr:TlpA family protein disulfide reductase [Bacteroidota bacterium]HMU13095.1 TlpA disulfide reductase family protein [Flavobacteriales bacterium]
MRVPVLPCAIMACLVSMAAHAAQPNRLSGRIIAPTGDSVFVQQAVVVSGKASERTLAAAKLDANGGFRMAFDLDSAQALTFFDGNEITQFFALPGEQQELTLHTAYFDESLYFAGDGAGRNNALAGLALANENEWNRVAQDAADTAHVDEQVDALVERLAKVMDEYAVAYPELANLLAERKAADLQGAAQQKQWMQSRILFKKRVVEMVGQPMTNLMGRDLDGGKLDLARYKGRITVLDFWATWCGPCKAEMPAWEALQKEYGDRINFVSISVWDNEDKWKEMSKSLGHAHSMFIPKTDLGQLEPYMVNAIPRYMVLDKDLRIVTIDAPRPSSGELQKFF